MKIGKNEFGYSIIIADDHEIIHRALKELISTFWPLVKTTSALTAEQLFDQTCKIQLVIIDPNSFKEFDRGLIYQVKQSYHNAKILVFTSFNEKIYAANFLKAGADGFLSKCSPESEIVLAITSVMAGGKYLNHDVKASLFPKKPKDDNQKISTTLSAREIKVAELLKMGLGVLKISEQLKLKMGTVSTYKIRIFRKLKVTNIIELSKQL